jgi:DNA replication and repair protein RecF
LKIEGIRIENFRNFEQLNQPLHTGFTIVAGQNAQGKTNFLESIYWISTTRLLRGQRDQEAIRSGSTFCRVEVTLQGDTELCGVLELGSRKKFAINRSPLTRAADIIGRLPTVSISLQDLAIIRGDPSDRRVFLDLELSTLYPAYLNHFTHYKRALEQRNALLKASQDKHVDDFAFETWEEPMAVHGEAMRVTRKKYLESLSSVATEFQAQLASRPEVLSFEYSQKDEGSLLDALKETRKQDQYRGFTQIGPHRDDLLIFLDGKEARLFGSQGQQRTSVISIKLATLSLGADHLGSTPILLLDDMLSDLDPERRSRLCSVVAQTAEQAILTCTEASAAGREIVDQAEVLTMDKGKIL